MAIWYPKHLRLVFLENGQVVTPSGIDEASVPANIFAPHKNLDLFKTIEEAKIGKVREFTPPTKKLIPTDGDSTKE